MTRLERMKALLEDVLDRQANEVVRGAEVLWGPYSVTASRVTRAYCGDLNAARKLHNETLGDGYISTSGYKAIVWMHGKASVWDVISGAQFGAEVPDPDLHDMAPARAWLIAILKALIAQEEAHA